MDREEVILFSDWTKEDPHEVMRNLKRGSERFTLEKGSAQSLIGAARLCQLGAFFEREMQRMPAMDIADVAYDSFLANGAPEIKLSAAPGETLRLRLINGSSTSYFFLEFSGGPFAPKHPTPACRRDKPPATAKDGSRWPDLSSYCHAFHWTGASSTIAKTNGNTRAGFPTP